MPEEGVRKLSAEERSGTAFRNSILRKTASLNFRTPNLYLVIIFEQDTEKVSHL